LRESLSWWSLQLGCAITGVDRDVDVVVRSTAQLDDISGPDSPLLARMEAGAASSSPHSHRAAQ